MKKCYLYILFGLICFFGFSMGVEAKQHLCKYEGIGVKDSKSDRWLRVNLYYDEVSKDYLADVENLKYVNNEEKTSDFGGVVTTKIIYENGDKSSDSFFKVSAGNFVCPSYVKVFQHSIKKYSVCFGNNSNINCNAGINNAFEPIKGEKIESLNLKNVKVGDSCTATVPYTDKDKKEKELKLEYMLNSSGNSLNIRFDCGNGFQELKNNNGATFSCGGQQFDLRNGTVSTANNSVLISSRSEFDSAFIKYWDDNKGDCSKLINIDQTDKNGVSPLLLPNAQEECKNGGCSNSNPNGFVDLDTWNYGWSNWYDLDGQYNNCEQLIGSKIIELINDILMYVRILVPILLIGLGIADFIKAMISSDEQAMSKAKNKFLKRLIVAAVIFLIPSLVNLIFNAINGVWAHINNSACNIWG